MAEHDKGKATIAVLTGKNKQTKLSALKMSFATLYLYYINFTLFPIKVHSTIGELRYPGAKEKILTSNAKRILGL